MKTGENILILPCQHRFHRICGMSWLVQRTNCPLCRASQSQSDSNQNAPSEENDPQEDEDDDTPYDDLPVTVMDRMMFAREKADAESINESSGAFLPMFSGMANLRQMQITQEMQDIHFVNRFREARMENRSEFRKLFGQQTNPS